LSPGTPPIIQIRESSRSGIPLCSSTGGYETVASLLRPVHGLTRFVDQTRCGRMNCSRLQVSSAIISDTTNL
jgi:hypothetical protein